MLGSIKLIPAPTSQTREHCVEHRLAQAVSQACKQVSTQDPVQVATQFELQVAAIFAGLGVTFALILLLYDIFCSSFLFG